MNIQSGYLKLVLFTIIGFGSTTAIGQSANVNGVTLVMTEVAKDGEFEIFPSSKFRKVDANSTLKLIFAFNALKTLIMVSNRASVKLFSNLEICAFFTPTISPSCS